MDKLTFEERNLIIDQVIADLKQVYNDGLCLSICASLEHVLACYGFPIISFTEDEFHFLEIPIIKSLGTNWWHPRDLISRIQFLKANKSAICQK